MKYLDVSRCCLGQAVSSPAGIITISGPEGVAVIDAQSEDCLVPEDKFNARLFAEAITQAHETHKGPRQLADELAEAVDCLRRIRDTIDPYDNDAVRMEFEDVDAFLAKIKD